MRKYVSRGAISAYLVALALLVWRADVKYGPDTAAWFAGVGLFFFLILARVWGYVLGILFGASRAYVHDDH